MTEPCLDEVNERTTAVITVDFVDEDGAPVTPDSATYRVDDERNRTNLVAPTAIGSLSTSVDIEITSDENRIIRSRNASEVRTLTVQFDYGVGKHGTAQYKYRLLSMYGVLDVPSASTSPSSSQSPST